MRVVVVAPTVIAVIGIVVLMAFGGSLPVARPVSMPVFLGLGAATTTAALVLPRVTHRIRSLRRVILTVALAAMVTTGTTILVAAALMMLDAGSVAVLVIVAVMGAAFGMVVEYAVARRLSVDARRLHDAAARIAKGDLNGRSGIDRADEIGEAARAIDTMASRLAVLETEREDAQTARQTFLAAVGHDLRTPLAALLAALDALEDGLAPDPSRYFAAMRTNIEAVRRLADDLFLLARIETGGLEFERVQADLSELADEAVEALTPMAVQKGVALRVRVDGTAVAEIGIGEVSRALQNLLDNAIRHAPPGSDVVVDIATQDRGVIMRVIDQGDGFNDDVLGRMVERPARTAGTGDQVSGRTGLGMTIARGLLEAHGGRIWIEDGPGGTVAMWIPPSD